MFYLFWDDDAFRGDLTRVHLCEGELQRPGHGYRGPFALRRDALKAAETLMWVAVGRNYERLLSESPALLEFGELEDGELKDASAA